MIEKAASGPDEDGSPEGRHAGETQARGAAAGETGDDTTTGPAPTSPWRRTPRSQDRWSDSTKAESSRRRWSAASIIATSASGVSSCLRAVPPTSTAPVGACASVRWNPLLGDSARSQGGPRWVSVVSEAHDHGPQPVPRYLDRLNGRDNPSRLGAVLLGVELPPVGRREAAVRSRGALRRPPRCGERGVERRWLHAAGRALGCRPRLAD
jgi:hypothetical protein